VPVDEKWVRDWEARVAVLEERVKGLTPFEAVRQMLKPLEVSLDSLKGTLSGLTSNVTSLVTKIEGLADSDRRLTDQHNALMAQRAKDEQEIHRLEKQGLELKNQKLEEELDALRKAPRGVIVWIKERAQPVTGWVVAIIVVIGAVVGFLYWIGAHVRP
jgi:chromosome segregation ATPase